MIHIPEIIINLQNVSIIIFFSSMPKKPVNLQSSQNKMLDAQYGPKSCQTFYNNY